MLQVWVIVLFAVMMLHDTAVGPGGARALLGWEPPPWGAATLTLAPMLIAVAATGAACRWALRAVDTRGSFRAVAVADRVVLGGRVVAIGAHAMGVLVFGWLDAVRAVVGDGVLYDELLAAAPALLVLSAGWWSYWPIDRALREAVMLRGLDSGRPIYPPPSRGRYVATNVRHQVMLTLTPMSLLLAWRELVEMVVSRVQDAAAAPEGSGVLARLGRMAGGVEGVALAGAGLELAGVAAVFLLTPLLMRVVWDTVPLGPGPIRERLLLMCRLQGVRVRRILVWRTHGTMVNGAVLGFWGPARYILLTDALLDGLPSDQVEAVMAHEVAHVKRRHMPWLAGAMGAGSIGAGMAGGWIVSAAVWARDSLSLHAVTGAEGAARTGAWTEGGLQLAVGAASLAGGMLVLGFVSRRFEWQADAFAAQHLSVWGAGGSAGVGEMESVGSGAGAEADARAREGMRATPAATDSTVTTAAAGAMSGALGSVARLNFMPPERGSWRHGSIAHRQRRLAQLVGRPVAGLPIDRTVRRIKRAVGVAAVVVAGLLWWGF